MRSRIESRISPIERLRNLCFTAYFVLLFCERLSGGILGIFLGGPESMLDSTTWIPKLVHPLTLLALALGILIMRRQWAPLFRSLAGHRTSLDTRALAAGIGFFLLSGMLHTGFLLLPIQFTAYGALAIGLILHVIILPNRTDARERIFSTAYLLCFSMTVPVVYDTAIGGTRGYIFMGVELVTMLYLVFAFASMTEVFLRTGCCNANPAVLFWMLALVGATFMLRLPEYANWLVAIFALLTLLVWILILIFDRRSIRFTLNPFDFTISRHY